MAASWLIELHDQCSTPQSALGRAVMLSLPTAADLLAVWCREARSYASLQPADWESVKADFREAVHGAGPRLRQLLKPHLKTMSHIIDRRAPIDDVRSSSKHAEHAAALRDTLSSPVGLQAAWRDLVSACQDRSLSPEDVTRHGRSLWQAILMAGNDVREMQSVIRSVLADEPLSIRWARSALGDAVRHDLPPRPGQEAGLADEQRLDLVERLLGSPSRQAHNIVWLAFAVAQLLAAALFGAVAAGFSDDVLAALGGEGAGLAG